LWLMNNEVDQNSLYGIKVVFETHGAL
jgi:hypothetical protein